MSTIRPFSLDTDYPLLVKWCAGHKAIPPHPDILPHGFIVGAGGVDIAAAFLYLDVCGHIAAVEYLTTNPSVGFSRFLVDDVRGLIAHIERVALEKAVENGRNRITVLSFTKPGSGEERLLSRLGYHRDGSAIPHNILIKPLTKEGG